MNDLSDFLEFEREDMSGLPSSFAKVSSVDTKGLQLIFDGETQSSGKVYSCNAGMDYKVGDRVKVSKDGSSYIVDYVVGDPGSRTSSGESGDKFPTGGSTGQVLKKKSDKNGDVEWGGVLPTGGTNGQILMKDGSTDQKVKWGSASSNTSISALTNGNYSATLDSSGNIVPKSTTYRGTVGTSSVPWNGLYTVGSISLGNALSKLGFFGATPISKITLSTSSSNQGFTTVTSSNLSTTGVYVLNNIVGILKKYGLIG